MALSHFKILTIFGNLQRAVNPSLKWLKRLLLHDCILQSKQHFYQKCVISCRPNDKTPAGQPKCRLCPKVDCYNFKFQIELKQNKERKKRSNNGQLWKCWEERGVTVQHHAVNMLTRNTISHILRPLMTIHSEWFSSCLMMQHLHQTLLSDIIVNFLFSVGLKARQPTRGLSLRNEKWV